MEVSRSIDESVHCSYLQRQSRLFKYFGRSPQLSLRCSLVDLLTNYWMSYKLHSTTLFLSVQLMDYFMDNMKLPDDKLSLLAVTCMQIAGIVFLSTLSWQPCTLQIYMVPKFVNLLAKCEEREVDIPPVRHLLEALQDDDSYQKFVSLELYVLGFFSWNVTQPTIAHFSEYYMQYVVDSMDVINGKWLTCSLNCIRRRAKAHVRTLYEIVLRNLKYKKYNPSRVGAAIVASTRDHLGLTPCWSEKLTEVSCHSFDLIFEVFLSIYRDYQMVCRHDINNKNISFLVTDTAVDAMSYTSSGYGSQDSSPTQ